MSKDRVGIETDNHLAKQDANAEALEEYTEIVQPNLLNILKNIKSMKNKAEAFPEIDLEEEIKSMIKELL